MKYLSFVVLLFFVGCSSTGDVGYMSVSKTNPTTGEFETINYSPYYELEYRTKDNVILARLVITLGPERVPEGYVHTEHHYASDMSKAYRNGIVDWVSEIYFINTSDAETKVTPIYLKVGVDEKDLNGEFSIQPAKWKISEPLIAISSVYGTQSNVEFSFIYNGEEHIVKGVAKRMTVNEIRTKYSR